MTKTIEIREWADKYGSEDERYGSLEELKELLLFKRITEWSKKHLLLEDGTKVTIEMSENDCCAYAGGEFKKVKLDAVITDVQIGKQNKFDNGDGTTSQNTVTIYHNQNPVAIAECEANDGNGGYYYSICSLVIGKIHFPVVEA